ncbi:hypothetical protein CVT26_010894 [Gymnopilus dilepis]|uniref:Uncharacterized protein n=1 Tax=Gymnopilus dilepis TaxID=231916 RepID=A0A409VIT4_9AGAR|nr:hypothetical protein CVT26_010894 [Gymnopilus dilepis]
MWQSIVLFPYYQDPPAPVEAPQLGAEALDQCQHGGAEVARVTFKNNGDYEVRVSWVENKHMNHASIKPAEPETFSFEAGKPYNLFFRKDKDHPYAERDKDIVYVEDFA